MTGRRILIAGGSSILGGGVARALQGEWRLWMTYRSPDKVEMIRKAFPEAQLACLDVLDAESITKTAASIKEKWGALDGVVYAVGKGLLWPAARMNDRQIDELFEVNVSGAQRVLRNCYPLLCAGEQPAVVLLSSIMGLNGAGGMSGYGASKAALIGLGRSLALEWAAKNIRVNVVAPGIVPSPLVEQMFKFLSSEQRDAIRARHPLGYGEPGDVGHAVRFLVSQESKWITGAVLPVDGGYSAQ